MEIHDIAHIVPAGSGDQAIYMKDGTVVKINTDDGSIISAFKLPTIADIHKALADTREGWAAV